MLSIAGCLCVSQKDVTIGKKAKGEHYVIKIPAKERA
jgi:hypothetical protein